MSDDVERAETGKHTLIGTQARPRITFAQVRTRVVDVIATLIRWVGTLIALLLTAHVVLTIGGANPVNAITRFVAEWARPCALGFADLFTPADPTTAVLVNYGCAALFWLIVTSIAVKIVRTLG